MHTQYSYENYETPVASPSSANVTDVSEVESRPNRKRRIKLKDEPRTIEMQVEESSSSLNVRRSQRKRKHINYVEMEEAQSFLERRTSPLKKPRRDDRLNSETPVTRMPLNNATVSRVARFRRRKVNFEVTPVSTEEHLSSTRNVSLTAIDETPMQLPSTSANVVKRSKLKTKRVSDLRFEIKFDFCKFFRNGRLNISICFFFQFLSRKSSLIIGIGAIGDMAHLLGLSSIHVRNTYPESFYQRTVRNQ